MKTLTKNIGILIISSLFLTISVETVIATVPLSPPAAAIAAGIPNGGLFAKYFSNMKDNPCTTPGQAIRSYSALLVPQCDFLFWVADGAGIKYTGDVNIDGAITTTSNINTPLVNGVPVGNFVSIAWFGPLTPGRIPKAMNFPANTVSDSDIFEDGVKNIGIGTVTPATKLHVNWTISATNDYGDRVYLWGDAAGNDMEIGTLSAARNTVSFWNRNLGIPMNVFAGTGTFSGLKISNGSEWVGKVLTSDANGNATWSTGGWVWTSIITNGKVLIPATYTYTNTSSSVLLLSFTDEQECADFEIYVSWVKVADPNSDCDGSVSSTIFVPPGAVWKIRVSHNGRLSILAFAAGLNCSTVWMGPLCTTGTWYVAPFWNPPTIEICADMGGPLSHFTRTVECRDSVGTPLPDVSCAPAPKPANTKTEWVPCWISA